MELSNEALNIYTQIESDTYFYDIGKCHLQIAKCHVALAEAKTSSDEDKKKNLEEACDHYKKSLKCFSSEDANIRQFYSKLTTLKTQMKAMLEDQSSDIKDILELNKQGEEITNELNCIRLQKCEDKMKINATLSQIYESFGKLEKALLYYKISVKSYKAIIKQCPDYAHEKQLSSMNEIRKKKLELNYYISKSHQENTRHPQIALQYALKAVKLAEKMGCDQPVNKRNLAFMLDNLATCYRTLGDYRLAHRHYARAAGLYMDLNMLADASINIRLLGELIPLVAQQKTTPVLKISTPPVPPNIPPSPNKETQNQTSNTQHQILSQLFAHQPQSPKVRNSTSPTQPRLVPAHSPERSPRHLHYLSLPKPSLDTLKENSLSSNASSESSQSSPRSTRH